MAVQIGARYTGQHQIHFDTERGTYWESRPKITGADAAVQRALLAPAPAQRRSLFRRKATPS